MSRWEDEEGILVYKLSEIPVKPPQPKKPKRKWAKRKKGHLMSPYERKVGHFLKMCPLCGGVLKVRHGRGGHRFLGCSGYPDCRYTEST